MASPGMAGYAALVQQFFKEGYYPSGVMNPADAFSPSGALVKAMLVHSGKDLKYVTHNDGTKTSTYGYPSNVQGYGKVFISDILSCRNILVIGDTNKTSPRHASLSSTDVTHRYSIVAPLDPSSIRVTLTYTDLVGSAGSIRPLVNDLELRVKLNAEIYIPYYDGYSDINNVEMIDIDNPCPGCIYSIEVRAVNISATQPYALVATSCITTGKGESKDGPLSFKTFLVIAVCSVVAVAVILYYIRVQLIKHGVSEVAIAAAPTKL
jgi:hypothetical protein